ncbi:MAG: hypothetical protein JST44_22335 [Cyanobacteria bacterium SZAS LIN-5]|nr:hypothetical protein [Cyanobacteria bacterium SZAS LIN-5]
MGEGFESSRKFTKEATQENRERSSFQQDDNSQPAHGARAQKSVLQSENKRKENSTKQYLQPFEIVDSKSREGHGQIGNTEQVPDNDKSPDRDKSQDSENRPTDALGSSDMKRLYEKNKGLIDTDNDGFITKSEIEQATASQLFKGQDAQFVSVLKGNLEKIQTLSDDEFGFENDGVTSKDIDAFNEMVNRADQTQAEKDLIGGIDAAFWQTGQKLKDASHELFADQENPLNSITFDAVTQGGIGDCYFVSALSSLARNNPQAIKDMIKDNENGTYTVTFPGDPTHPVTIDAPTDAEMSLYASGNKGIWPSVIEKAYGKYYDQNKTVSQDGVPNGSMLHDGVRILSPSGVDIDLISYSSSSEIDAKLQQAIKDGQPVTVGINGNILSLIKSGYDKTEQGLQRKHEYSVEDYDPATKTVTIRNPWGRGEPVDADGKPRDGKDDGVFTMSLDEFQRTFSDVAYGQKKSS